MKLTVLDQYAKGLVHCDQTLGEEMRDKIERLKWSLWHGNLYKALYKIDDIESLIYNFEETYPKFKQLLKALGACPRISQGENLTSQNAPGSTIGDLVEVFLPPKS